MTTHLLIVTDPGDADGARVLARTVRRYHPDWVTWLCSPAPGPIGGWDTDRVLGPGEAAALLHLLRDGAEQVFRLRAASVLLGPLEEAEALLATAPVVRTTGNDLLALRGAEARGWVEAWAARGGPLPDPPPGAAVLHHPGYGVAWSDPILSFTPDGTLRAVGQPVRLLRAGDPAGEPTPGRTEPLDLLRWLRAEREDARVVGPLPSPTPEALRAEYLAWQAREFARAEAEGRAAGGRFRAALVAVARRLPGPVRRVLRRLRGG